MCYSALIKQSLKNLGLEYYARIDEALFEEMFQRRAVGEILGIPKALGSELGEFDSPSGKKIKHYVELYKGNQVESLEKDLFTQKKRFADMERKLVAKPTKTAEKERDVAGRQIERIKQRLERLRSKALTEADSRIFAFDWSPVIIWRNDQRVIVPMRYHLRPPGMEEDFDRKYPGCYNARRDSLTGFWRKEFGKKHAILVIESFYEHVNLHEFERRELRPGEKERNIVIQFRPEGMDRMIVPCIWDEWQGPEGTLCSFALITDEPPSEVAATGHDRCPIFIKESKITDWLRPEGKSDEELFAILDDRQTPYYRAALAG